MLRALTWKSEEQSPRLTPAEVDCLFVATYQMAEAGQLFDGKYVGTSQPLWWHRQRGDN